MAENDNTQPAATEPAPAAPASEPAAEPAPTTPVLVPAEVTAASRAKQTGEDVSFAVDQDVLDVMNHDPFPGGELPEEPAADPTAATQQPSEQKTTEPAPPAEGAPPAAVQGQVTVPAPAPAASAPATPTAVPAAPAPTAEQQTAALQLQVQSLTAALAQMQQQTQKAPAPDAQTPAEKPDFMLQVPDQLIQLMGSEDPNQVRQGIQALMAGLGQHVHEVIMGAVDKKFAEVPNMITQGQQVLAQRQNIFNDFYQAHADLNQPALHTVVAQTAAEVSAETGLQTWSPQLRDAIATRVRQKLGQIQGTVQVPAPATVPAAAPAAVPQPPAMLNSGVSPAPRQKEGIGDEINELFLFG